MTVLSLITLRISANYTTVCRGRGAKDAALAHCRPGVTNEIERNRTKSNEIERNRTKSNEIERNRTKSNEIERTKAVTYHLKFNLGCHGIISRCRIVYSRRGERGERVKGDRTEGRAERGDQGEQGRGAGRVTPDGSPPGCSSPAP